MPQNTNSAAADSIEQADHGALIIPLVAEEAVIHKEVVETAKVRISTHVEQRRQLISQALRHEEVVVERVLLNRPVDVTPTIRQEGDVLIYPIVEEELVVTKRLILKEELRISRKVWSEPIEREVDLRSMSATVDRTELPTPTQSSTEPKETTHE